ncbi:MAG: 4-hydroxybenzoate octaprenyltransferase [Pseudomonadota bacterium]|jgi:4-hydroxybenzoate polyprenyl transferase, proteobacterial|nr:MAG: 4-hydroxybenzoate octaprenyltransferase [Pseudomonadota bacterium]
MTAAPQPFDQPVADAAAGNWVDRYAPPASRPYLRLARMDRPIGWWLLLLPCWWSLALAAIATGTVPNLWYALLFFIGAVAMRGAGSTYNDIVDRDLDGMVARTRMRPLPSGQVKVAGAAAFLVLQALVGLAVLLQFNDFAILVGFLSLVPVAIYPFMKRFMSMPQLVLGLAFAWGGLIGWAVVTETLAAPAYLAYAAAIFWTIGYDTIYALQDIEDDPIAGIKSSARLFGSEAATGVAVCYAVAVVLVGLAAHMAGGGLLAFVAVGAFALHLAWQVRSIELDNPQKALRLFKSNRDAGLILALGLAADALLRASF